MSKPPPAKAADVVAIKIASVTRTRIAWSPDLSGRNLIQRADPRVKAADQTAGKPNA
jgi:hypothetical protein